jgi:hypothetical protein
MTYCAMQSFSDVGFGTSSEPNRFSLLDQDAPAHPN